jgi:hypothetical protein
VARATPRQVHVTLGDYVINSAVEPLPAYTFGVSQIQVGIKAFFYNCQKNVTFMHRYQVAKYVIFDSEKIFVKKFPWMLK